MATLAAILEEPAREGSQEEESRSKRSKARFLATLLIESLDPVMPDIFSGLSQKELFLPKQFERAFCHLKFPRRVRPDIAPKPHLLVLLGR